MSALNYTLPIPARRSVLSTRHEAMILAVLCALTLWVTNPDLFEKASAVIAHTKSDPLLLAAVVLIYMGLIALPFVPGAELGLMLLAMFGAALALPLYLATVLALTGAFVMGRMADRRLLPGWRAGPEGATRAPDPFTDVMDRQHPAWLTKVFRVRALALILLINMPGNTVLGGGGGISFMAGMTRQFSLASFVACVAIAVAPVPMMVLSLPLLGDTDLGVWVMERLALLHIV
jgi:hypothetical protein